MEVGGKFKAYPFSALEEIGRPFSDSLQGQDYVVCWDTPARSAKVIDQRGEPFPTLTAYWFAWYAFHPDTDVFLIDSNQARPEKKALHPVCEER